MRAAAQPDTGFCHAGAIGNNLSGQLPSLIRVSVMPKASGIKLRAAIAHLSHKHICRLCSADLACRLSSP